ncbi:hypothetical protein N1851_027826 [Merluccius polli]|uniref:Uncharacterized protein n=1 Tax=Merluccius polli TaxID=89951 RepID=A0AA47NS17_MERPO|nr:hypothetical protein N1851_027826 [Merluccius polli]
MSGHGRRDLREAKFNAPKLLPFTDDVRLLHAHLAKEVVSTANWKWLCEATLTNVILFNRQSEGEVSKMELKFFQSRKKSVPIEEVQQHLTANEMSMFSHFTRIELPGKLSQGVPLLLTPQTEEALELLCNECAVKKNIYLFARPEKDTYLRELRKQIATLLSVLNLKDADRDQLARYLGHIRIHDDFYRLKLDTLQIAKVSKLLLAMQQGQIGDYIGMNLDEIDISPDDSVSDLESSGTELSVELAEPSKKSHTNMPDLVTFAEPDPEPEPESTESYLQKTKDASTEKGTVDILGQFPTKSGTFLKSQVNYCFVCEKPQTKFACHLEKHVNENAEIAQALQFPKSSKDRKVLLEKFRNLGNFKHNSIVKTTGSGCLKVKRSSKQRSSPETYDYCLYCKGMLSRK